LLLDLLLAATELLMKASLRKQELVTADHVHGAKFCRGVLRWRFALTRRGRCEEEQQLTSKPRGPLVSARSKYGKDGPDTRDLGRRQPEL
jgi:hypothetical protein